MEQIYLYDSSNKMELFGKISSLPDAEIEPALDRNRYLVCRTCITVEQRVPLGSLLADIISLDFDELMDLVRNQNWPALESLLGLSIDPATALRDINVLYVCKEYIDLCNQFPSLFTSEHFDSLFMHFSDFPISYENDPELIGQFVDVAMLSQNQIVLQDIADLEIAESKIDIDTYCFNRNAKVVRDIMLADGRARRGREAQAAVYRLNRGTAAAIATMHTLIGERAIPRKCGICGKYFVPLNRSDTLYCDRISPADPKRTCKEYGSQRLWYDRIKSDEAAKLSRNIYSAKQMLVRRNPDIPGYKEMLEFFKIERKKWELLVRLGKKTREEYIAWLNEMKSRKTLK